MKLGSQMKHCEKFMRTPNTIVYWFIFIFKLKLNYLIKLV